MMAHIPRRHKLPLLDVHGAPSSSSGDQQVRLPAQERRNLQHVDSLGSNLAVAGLMHIGQHRQAGIFGDAPQDAHAFNQPWPAEALHAGAVGLVVAGLEDVRHAKIGGDALNALRHAPRMIFRLDHARPGNQEKLARAHLDGPDFERLAHEFDSIVIDNRATCRLRCRGADHDGGYRCLGG